MQTGNILGFCTRYIRHWKTWLANYQFDAEYQPTTFNFSSNWVQGICSKDKKACIAIHRKISDAATMKDDTTATKSSMAFETSFNGSIHIGARANRTRNSEEYIGVFNLTEKIEIGKVVNVPTATPGHNRKSQ